MSDYQIEKLDETHVQVTSPKGDVYTLTVNGGTRCSCPGFKFRGQCKHMAMLPEMAEQRFPRGVVNKVLNNIYDILDNVGRWEVAGSYRRGKSDIGDIDILIECDGVLFIELGKALVSRGLTIEAGGNDVLRCRHTKEGIQVDVNRVKEGCWASHLLHRTGSKENNIKMRAAAKAKGWRLNEYGLHDEYEAVMPTPTEESIFDALGLLYLEPSAR